ncbi:MAG: dTDP-4-dehydrorhamnose reductase [Actinobacteria bacterium]|nr:dTDP-4-dehydrorhamnose reductase [Actinomycetota bacterium]
MASWLVTGAAGMLGVDLVTVLRDRGESVTGCTHRDLDITDRNAVESRVDGHDVVANLAAWTAVDDAEQNETSATLVNGTGPTLLARACRRTGARMIQLSTDYVFSGQAPEPYPEDGATDPVNAYGRSKRAGEVGVRATLPESGYVVRTAWLYGAHGPNFVSTMARLAKQRPTLDVVDDQFGQPTWTVDVARQLVTLIHTRAPAGIYHATSTGQTTWYGLARAVFEELDLDPARVRPTDSASFVRPARRPAYSVLGHAAHRRVGLDPIRNWREALGAAAPSVLAQFRSSSA